MILTPEQCQELIANGGKITTDDGEEIEFPKDAPADNTNTALLGIISQLLGTVKDIQAKASAFPTHPSPAPTPPAPKSPACWNCHVQERDKDGRVVRFQFKEWSNP